MKHPTALAIGLPDVGGEFGSCSVSLMDFTEFDLQRIPYSFHASIYKGVTLSASYARCKCMGYYNKLAAFIPIAKDV
ncbi:SsrA-binding protein [Helicobacter pylori]|uniref:SsrA-binding protein n=1 Tax=Helicobacter pylori TaxID=210 RepID=UPI001FCF9488|nr:SsrA-binding protein [Helicobacter pylori]UOS57032.1 SsrA-binding protein [Helicobacter pylori]